MRNFHLVQASICVYDIVWHLAATTMEMQIFNNEVYNRQVQFIDALHQN